jgi:hypothetical protein
MLAFSQEMACRFHGIRNQRTQAAAFFAEMQFPRFATDGMQNFLHHSGEKMCLTFHDSAHFQLGVAVTQPFSTPLCGVQNCG